MLTLTALGIVFGDIGTSPLYALRECFHPSHGIAAGPPEVLGVLSLIFWALVLVISLKYVTIVLRADNRGEGGILALMALVRPRPSKRHPRAAQAIVVAGLFGAALLYGDSTITPAISVLSAVEGLEVVTPVFGHYVIPITLMILVALFAVQKRGTANVGVMFGPVTLLWFLAIALLGLAEIAVEPRVLGAVNPAHAVTFFAAHRGQAFFVLGAVFLVVTGGEALYADMGHFGARPIRRAWFGLVLPALLLNYFGQGALLLRDPTTVTNPFFLLAPSWARWPLVALATVATVIASQAVISGAFSITRQAVHLGYLPRLDIRHTSAEEIGQIYVPVVNWTLLAVTIALVLGFQRSSNLASAYGIAVSTTMAITTALTLVVARKLWRWSLLTSVLVLGALLAIDVTFLGATLLKVLKGGWFPLLLASALYVVFITWKRGRELLWERLQERNVALPVFLQQLRTSPAIRLRGRTGIFMTAHRTGTPPILPHHVRHNGVLAERVILLTVLFEEVPHVNRIDRLELEDLGDGFTRVVAHFGFMETASVARIFRYCRAAGLALYPADVTYFLGRETVFATKRHGMAIWRERLFSFMSRNAQRAPSYFRIPAGQVFEIGVYVEL